jgi:hypothetical protein
MEYADKLLLTNKHRHSLMRIILTSIWKCTYILTWHKPIDNTQHNISDCDNTKANIEILFYKQIIL